MIQSPPLKARPNSPARTAAQLLSRAAPTKTTILLSGEAGVGKTRMASWIHANSPFASRAFVPADCISDSIEASCFGTDSSSGKIYEAEGGTLFLDEIGELTLPIQARLLQLIQERSYRPVGATKNRHANIRIVAASNRDLKHKVELGEFREDLFYRLTVVDITIPPLRDRPEMIPSLAQTMLAEIVTEAQLPPKTFDPTALHSLANYTWPGNLREMRSAIERVAILSGDANITTAHVEEVMDTNHHLNTVAGTFSAGEAITIEELETEHIRRILDSSKSLTAAATTLGIDTSTLFRKRRRLGLLPSKKWNSRSA